LRTAEKQSQNKANLSPREQTQLYNPWQTSDTGSWDIHWVNNRLKKNRDDFNRKKFHFGSDKKRNNTMIHPSKKTFSGKRKYLPKYAKLSRLTLPIRIIIDGTIVCRRKLLCRR